MNLERLNYSIEIMHQAHNLDMSCWQDGEDGEVVGSIEELHSCGNTACFAGYLAISPEWDGEVTQGGQPYYPCSKERPLELIGANAVNKFLGMSSETHKDVIKLVVMGITHYYYYNVSTEHKLEGVSERSQYEFELATRVGQLVEDRPWGEWRPEDVIKILEALRDGHFDDIELGEDDGNN